MNSQLVMKISYLTALQFVPCLQGIHQEQSLTKIESYINVPYLHDITYKYNLLMHIAVKLTVHI